MPRNLVLNEGVLAEKIVTESHQPIELAQLDAEVASHQTTVDSLTSQLENLTKQKTEAEVALEDSKSDVESAKSLVASVASTNTAAEESTEDGTVESAENNLAQPVTEF